jgi:NADH dehydrogenase ubiquinone Fe-S protein 4
MANSRKWKLRFERRSPPFIEFLMGWTGGDDVLAQVELTFPSAQAAISYARRQGLAFIVHEPKPDGPVCAPTRLPPCELAVDTFDATARNSPAEDDQARNGAAPDCANPSEVLHDPKRSIDQKREILRCWALAAYIQNAVHEESSQLDKIIDALIDRDETVASRFAVKDRRTTRINRGARAA